MLFSDLVLYNKAQENSVEAVINPTQYSYLYNPILDLEGAKKAMKKGVSHTYRWEFQKDRHTTLWADNELLIDETQDITFKVFDPETGKPDDNKSISIKYEANEFSVRNNEYDKFKLRDLKFSSSLSKYILVYSPYVVVNKTNISLTLGSGKKKNDLEVYQQTSEYFNPHKETKLFITTDEYDWSNAFDFTTIGVSGELSLKRTSDKQSYRRLIKEYNAKTFDIGVVISSLDSNFYKTIAITFVPRYVL